MRKINFSPPDIKEEEKKAVREVLESGWITTGPRTKAFEGELANYIGTSNVVCLNSATAGLELILRVLGIGQGDEVITTAYTYTASASVIQHVGAKIVLVDTVPGSYFMDMEQVDHAITNATKAIIGVDFAGMMCDYERLIEIAEVKKISFEPRNKLQEYMGRIAVIADAAHSLGATCKGKRSGSVADFTSFSFHAVKNLTTAEGGAVTFSLKDKVLANQLYREFMLWALHGQTKDALEKTKPGSWEYDIEVLGYKCNMTDMMAAMGSAQLQRYGEILQIRKQVVKQYEEGLKDLPIEVFAHKLEQEESSYHLCPVQLIGKEEGFRNQLIEKLSNQGIATNVHYKPLPMYTAYQRLGFRIEDYPNAYNMYQKELTLPLHTLLQREDVEYIIESIYKAWR